MASSTESCQSDEPSEAQLARRLLEQGHYQAALSCFRQVSQVVPSADTSVSQAVCLIHLNRPKEALQACEDALLMHHQHAQAWLFRGVALHRLGRFQDAYSSYRLASEASHLDRRSTLRYRCWTRLKRWSGEGAVADL